MVDACGRREIRKSEIRKALLFLSTGTVLLRRIG